MEEIDRKILTALQQDGAITNAALADRVNLSPSSCLRRVQKLKQDGVIRKTVALVDTEKVGRELTAIVDVYLERHGDEPRKVFFAALEAEPAVQKVYTVAGECDTVLVLSLTGMKEYQGVCDRLFERDPNVVKFTTKFVLECHKDETAIPV